MLRIDLHEPNRIYQLISQSVDSSYNTLNPEYADYMWDCADGSTKEWERKTWAELCADLDSVEVQIRRERQAHPKHQFGLIVEGIGTPSMMGVEVWKRGGKSDVFFRTREYHMSFKAIMSWLYQVEKYMEVHYTASLEATASALVAFYQSDQKDHHTTFSRHLNTMDFHNNKQVEMMMAIGKGIGIGPAKAEELIFRYGTVWNILSSQPDALMRVGGMGKTTVTNLLRKVGRPDV